MSAWRHASGSSGTGPQASSPVATAPTAGKGLEQAKGKRVYLFHSPEDKVTPVRFAELARENLGKSGAAVEMKTYEGGHGWKGDVFGAIKDGMTWLAGAQAGGGK